MTLKSREKILLVFVFIAIAIWAFDQFYYTPQSRRISRLKEELKKVRQIGYAIDQEEVEIGLTCVGVPIRDFTGKVVAAISISGPTLRMSKDMIPEYIRLAADTGKKISNALGFKIDSKGD